MSGKSIRAQAEPVFVSRQTAAQRLEISVDTFDTWVHVGFVPPAHINRGQTVRWHWPSIEAKLSETPVRPENDPFIIGLENEKKSRRRVAA